MKPIYSIVVFVQALAEWGATPEMQVSDVGQSLPPPNFKQNVLWSHLKGGIPDEATFRLSAARLKHFFPERFASVDTDRLFLGDYDTCLLGQMFLSPVGSYWAPDFRALRRNVAEHVGLSHDGVMLNLELWAMDERADACAIIKELQS